MAENMATRLQSEAFAKTGIEHTRIEQWTTGSKPHLLDVTYGG